MLIVQIVSIISKEPFSAIILFEIMTSRRLNINNILLSLLELISTLIEWL